MVGISFTLHVLNSVDETLACTPLMTGGYRPLDSVYFSGWGGGQAVAMVTAATSSTGPMNTSYCAWVFFHKEENPFCLRRIGLGWVFCGRSRGTESLHLSLSRSILSDHVCQSV